METKDITYKEFFIISTISYILAFLMSYLSTFDFSFFHFLSYFVIFFMGWTIFTSFFYGVACIISNSVKD